MGLALTQLGQHEEALLSLEKVVNSHFSFLHIIQARMVLGYIYSVTGRFRLAEFEFAKVNEMGLQSSQALAALGYVYYAQRKVPESVETLKKALEIEPKNPNALNSLGFIYAEEKIDLGRAVTLCRQAVEIAPRNAAYLDSLGWAYFRDGQLRRGARDLPARPGPRPGEPGDRRPHARLHGRAEGRAFLAIRERIEAAAAAVESAANPMASRVENNDRSEPYEG